MADIKKELNDIKSAVYGREVRGAIHDGIKKINDEAENATDLSESAKHQVENIQQQVNQLVVEGDSSVEAAQARVDAEGKSYPTLKARLDAKETQFSSQLADNTNKIGTLFKRTFVSITEYGAVSDYDDITKTGTDNAQAILDSYNAVSDGGTIFIPQGKYRTTQPLPAYKNVRYVGETSGGSTVGSVLVFDGCSGIIPKKSYIVVKDVDLIGINKSPTFDIATKQLGTIGIDCKLSATTNSGGFLAENVRVEGFNVGLAIRNDGGGWAGAYRDFYSPKIHRNDVGVLVLDGGTHNKIFGGVISNNTKHGIYADASIEYNNLEIIGTTIELNGSEYDKFLDDNWSIYAGNETKIKITNGYLEKTKVFANTNGRIFYNGCHIHSTTRHFAKGTITDNGSFSGNRIVVKHGNGDDILNKFVYANCTATSKGLYTPGVKVTSSAKNVAVQMISKWDYGNIRGLPVSELEWIKLSARIKVNSGSSAPGFAIIPYFRIEADGPSFDGMNVDITVPMRLWDFSINQYQKIEFYYKPRTVAGYLDINDMLVSFMYGFLFFSDPAIVDYSVTSLDVDILDPIIELYTKTETTII